MKTETAIIKINPSKDETVISLLNEATKILAWANQRTIATAEDVKIATEDLSLIANLKKAVAEKRVEYLEPLKVHEKIINDAFKLLSEPLQMADRITRDKVLAYNNEIERQRQEAERINQLRMEAARAEMELKGELTESVDLVEVTKGTPKRVSTELGNAELRNNWKWEVIDLKLVPDEYKMINAGMVTPIVKASKGKITIPGIRIYNEPILAIKTR